MNIESLREYCLSLPYSGEKMPFDESVLAFTVCGKIFAMINIDAGEFIVLKCDPDRADELREQYEGITPGYHCNKKHWNSVYLQNDVSDNLIKELITHSYNLIFASLPRKIHDNLQ